PIIILVSNVLGGLVSIIGVAFGVISKVVAGITTMAAGFGFLTGATSTVIGGIAALVTSFLSIATVAGVVVVAFGIMG
ncbi:hypothetical protein CVR96_26000, partial [Salmonella enterica subsp. enterica serovar Typhimurium]|uniref:hypothetical protein n=1 Tax=Salmonella enterica TaxID=28901 RepID=UPI000CB0950C